MSEDATPYEVIESKILQLASLPFPPDQHAQWQNRVNAAYRSLSMNVDFRLVLQHWTVKVLLNPDADPGARRLIIEMIQSMNALNQIQAVYQQEGETRDGW